MALMTGQSLLGHLKNQITMIFPYRYTNEVRGTCLALAGARLVRNDSKRTLSERAAAKHGAEVNITMVTRFPNGTALNYLSL